MAFLDVKRPIQAHGNYAYDPDEQGWVPVQTSGGSQNVNLAQWGGTALTGRDITVDIEQLSRTIGDAGAGPTDTPGETVLHKLERVSISVDDDTAKGLLRSIGDAGAAPTNVTGNTVLQLLSDIITALGSLPATQWNPLSSGQQTSAITADDVATLDTGLLGGRLVVNLAISNPTQATTVALQGSSDGANWNTLGIAQVLAGGGTDFLAIFGAFRYLRANVTAIAGDITTVEIASSR